LHRRLASAVFEEPTRVTKHCSRRGGVYVYGQYHCAAASAIAALSESRVLGLIMSQVERYGLGGCGANTCVDNQGNHLRHLMVCQAHYVVARAGVI
jgi:hypothetical protein